MHVAIPRTMAHDTSLAALQRPLGLEPRIFFLNTQT